MADTIVYTTSSCPYCRYVKDFLKREGVNFQEKNVELDGQAAREMVSRTGQQGVPVTLIAGQAIIGFDQPALKTAVARLRQQNGGSGSANRLKLGAGVASARMVLARQGKAIRAGAILGQVQNGSLAARAGLCEGDVIVGLNGHPVTGPEDLATGLQNLSGGQTANPDLVFWRDERELTTRLPLK